MDLPKFLLDLLEKNDYIYESVLQYNKRKSTYVLKIKHNNNCYLLKAYDKNKTPQDIKNKFIIEKEFYENNKNIDSIPKLIYFYENILILEYFDSISLRDYLIRVGDKKNLLKNLIQSLEMFDKKLYRKENNLNSYDNVFRYISSLCNSHPFQAKDIKISFLDKILNKIINKLLVLKVEKILDNSDFKNLKSGFSHNDFHYNNILISKNNDIKFIDFENIKYQGFFEFDILFLIVIIEVYLNNYEQKILNSYKNLLFQKNKILEKIHNIFKIAISINKKFYLKSKVKSLNKFEKIKLLVDLLIKE